MKCPYCGESAELVNGLEMYGRRDLAGRKIWRCVPCRASVGCHPGTSNPLGTMADDALRQARMNAHAAFDPLWKNKCMTRHEAYTWISDRLGLQREQCHIGRFDVAMCKKVVAACLKWADRQRRVRERESPRQLSAVPSGVVLSATDLAAQWVDEGGEGGGA